jgi:hypothetical protein
MRTMKRGLPACRQHPKAERSRYALTDFTNLGIERRISALHAAPYSIAVREIRLACSPVPSKFCIARENGNAAATQASSAALVRSVFR